MSFTIRLTLSAAFVLSVWNAPAHAAITSKDLGGIWFIGDSITRSNADGDSSGSPRKSLYDKLNEAGGYTFEYTGHTTENFDGLPSDNAYIYHSGISASVIGDNPPGTSRVGMTENLATFWNSGRLAGAGRVDELKPNVILIMLGTNDVNLDLDVAAAPERIDLFVDAIFALPDIGDPSVFVATIPPNRRSAEATARVAAFNAELPGIVDALRTDGRDVTLVDHFTPLDANYATAIRADDLHPNSFGNDIIGQQWFNAIQARAVPEPTSIVVALIGCLVLLGRGRVTWLNTGR